MKRQAEGINAVVFTLCGMSLNYRATCRYIEMLSLFVNVKCYPLSLQSKVSAPSPNSSITATSNKFHPTSTMIIFSADFRTN